MSRKTDAMNTTTTPFDYMNVGFQAAQLGVEAHAVIWMRMMGMAGAWNTPSDETARMWREKPAAFTEAMGRGVQTALSGGAPERVLAATIAPLHRDAASNRRRLADRGARSL